MADEINKRKPNIKPYTTAVDRMRSESRKPTAEIIKEKSAIDRHQENYDKAKSENDTMLYQRVGMDPDKVMDNLRQMERSEKSRSLHEDNLSTLWAARKQVAENNFVSQVRNISTGSPSSLEQARASVAARELINSGAYNESSIAKGLNRIPRQIDERQKRVVEMASDPKGNVEDFLKAAEGLESSKIKYQNLRVGEKEIKRLGLDSASVIKSSYDTKDSILNSRASDSLSDRVASGAHGSLKQESSKLKESEDRFLEAQKKFADALSSGEEDVEGFKKALTDSTKSLEEQKKLVDEMKRQGAGGGTNRMANLAAGMGFAGKAFGSASDIIMDTMVYKDTQQMSQRAGFARAVNQDFNDHYNATQGDMMALSLVMDKTAGVSTKYGVEQQGDATLGMANKAAHVGLSTTAAGAEALGKTSLVAPAAGAAALAKVLVDAAPMAANVATDIYKGISANDAALQGKAVRRDLNVATNEIKAATRQEFFNTSMGNFNATIGFGGKSSDVFSSMQGNRRAFAELGLQAEDVQSIYQTGVQSMGADFTRLGTSGMASLAGQAGRVQEAGVTSAQDYISRIGQASQTGGGIREVEDVLANAVARGVDNAKSFGAMVDAVSSMSGQSAAMGVNTSGSATRALLASMDTSKGNGLNEQLNLNAAQQQAKLISGMTGDTGTNFSTMMEQAQLTKAFPNSRKEARVNFMGADVEQIRQIKMDVDSGNTDAAMTNAKRLGIASMLFSEDGSANKAAIDKAIEIKQEKVGSNAMVTMSREESDRLKRGEAAKTLGESDARIATTGVTGEGAAQLSGKGFAKGQLTGPSGERAAGFQATQAQATGRATMGEAGEATASLAQIASTMQSIANTLQPMAAAKNAAQGAAEMKLDSGAFDKSVQTFEQAVQLLINKLGEKGGPIQPPMPGARPMIKRGSP